MLTIGSLFSGIGGLELGLEWSGLGPVKWQCELNEWCRGVLARHWPEAERFKDVTTVANPARVDLICGGFPCQDISVAGKREGLAGSRSGLWSQYRRIVSEIVPPWIVVENVGGNANAWVDAVSRDLAELGYVTLPIPLTAYACGALHERARVFIVGAHCDGQRKPREKQAREPEATRGAPNPHSLRELQPEGREPHKRRWTCDNTIWTTEPDVARVVYGLPRRMARERRRRERALGNSVVPQCAEVVGWVIRELAGLTP